MINITVYWFVDADGVKTKGHDTFQNETELSEYEIDAMINI